jgi:hypothetical protein
LIHINMVKTGEHKLRDLSGDCAMIQSRKLAEIIGPSMFVLAATEVLNYDTFAGQIAPVVYLNGTVLFVAGLAIIRAHNVWSWSWAVLVTLTGWVVFLLGLYQMIAPAAPQAAAGAATNAGLAAMALIGAFLTFKAYYGGHGD